MTCPGFRGVLAWAKARRRPDGEEQCLPAPVQEDQQLELYRSSEDLDRCPGEQLRGGIDHDRNWIGRPMMMAGAAPDLDWDRTMTQLRHEMHRLEMETSILKQGAGLLRKEERVPEVDVPLVIELSHGRCSCRGGLPVLKVSESAITPRSRDRRHDAMRLTRH